MKFSLPKVGWLRSALKAGRSLASSRNRDLWEENLRFGDEMFSLDHHDLMIIGAGGIGGAGAGGGGLSAAQVAAIDAAAAKAGISAAAAFAAFGAAGGPGGGSGGSGVGSDAGPSGFSATSSDIGSIGGVSILAGNPTTTGFTGGGIAPRTPGPIIVRQPVTPTIPRGVTLPPIVSQPSPRPPGPPPIITPPAPPPIITPPAPPVITPQPPVVLNPPPVSTVPPGPPPTFSPSGVLSTIAQSHYFPTEVRVGAELGSLLIPGMQNVAKFAANNLTPQGFSNRFAPMVAQPFVNEINRGVNILRGQPNDFTPSTPPDGILRPPSGQESPTIDMDEPCPSCDGLVRQRGDVQREIQVEQQQRTQQQQQQNQQQIDRFAQLERQPPSTRDIDQELAQKQMLLQQINQQIAQAQQQQPATPPRAGEPVTIETPQYKVTATPVGNQPTTQLPTQSNSQNEPQSEEAPTPKLQFCVGCASEEDAILFLNGEPSTCSVIPGSTAAL